MPGPPPPCGIAERLVQVQVADVGADRGRARQADLRVHVGAVHVHLAAVLRARSRRCPGCSPRRRRASTDRSPSARPAARLCSSAFASRSATSMLPSFVLATTTTRMPAMTALAGLVPCADAGMSTTSRCRVAAIAMVGADHHQPGELALRAGVRLQRHGGEAGDLGRARARARGRSAGSPPSARPARTDAASRTPAR